MKSLGFVEPMKARLMEHPPSGDWIYEIKYDGFRTLALKSGHEIELFSRNKKNFNLRFPEIARALTKLKVKQAVIDGEIVAVEASGKSSFQLLQAYDLGEVAPPLFFYAFDLLQLNGNDLRHLTLVERKAQLQKILRDAPASIRFSDSLEGDVDLLMEQARQIGLEGLIGKRKDSVYETGQRTGAWVKLKISLEQEFVIGGYTNPQGSRKFLGSILVGYYDNNKFLFAGKVGTGFNEKSLRALYADLKIISILQCPFANLPETKSGRWSPAMTLSEMRKCHWVEPKLVAQIRYAEWTRDGKLRHPVYLGLRPDKNARDVVKEIASG